MTCGEYQPQQIVANVIVQLLVALFVRRGVPDISFVAELLVLTLRKGLSTQVIYGAMLGRCHEPRARVMRNPRPGPLLKGGNESILGQFLCDTHIQHEPGKPGDQSGGFNPPDCLDCALSVWSRHGLKSIALQLLASQRPAGQRPGEPGPGALRRKKRLCAGGSYFLPGFCCISANPSAAFCTSGGKSDIS